MKGSSKRKVAVAADGTDEKQRGCWDRAAKSGSSTKGAKSGKVRMSSEHVQQQPQEMLPASVDSGRKYIRVLKRLPRPDKAPAPKFSVTACHECRQIERKHRWCLRSLNCGSPMEAVVSAAAPADVKLPRQGCGLGQVQDSSVARNDASVAPKKSRKSIISRPAKSARTADLTHLSASDASTALSLASGAAVGPQSQYSGSRPSAPPQPGTYYDPFINLRLDIDNMSYEELLALQEQIGYVSTGLSEEELGKCRKTDVYKVKRRKTAVKKEADPKCSICQVATFSLLYFL
uniref:RING-type E3 ubiquitin transferase n=1 Tax=Kalanchoe fedtschenkoi TaxID=63787 RepID=A0A7N0UTJ0_KALFE